MRYLLDTNVFLAANNLHYGMDFCPAFWEWLIQENKAGKVFSTEKVLDELRAAEDEVSEWAAGPGAALFLVPSVEIVPAMGLISKWIEENGYTPDAKDAFFKVADYWLIAHALAGGFTVVTHEAPADTVKKIKIPNVCLGVKVKVMTPFEMLRRERARFVLGPKG